MNRISAVHVLTVCGLMCAAPAYSATPADPMIVAQAGYANYGVIDSIDIVPAEHEHSGAGGAIVGGVIGGLLGHQIGRGSGNTAATVVGAVGGAVAGNEIAEHANRPGNVFRVRVVLENGAQMMLNESSIGDLRVGDRVRVENNQLFRY